MANTPKGKGSNFDTRKNPFQAGIKLVGSRPELASVARLGLALDRVLNCGCAAIIGSTRDGGAVCITILDGEDRHRTYCSNDEELDAAITQLEQSYEKPF